MFLRNASLSGVFLAPTTAGLAVWAFFALGFLAVHAVADVAGNDKIVIAGRCLDERATEISGAKVRLFRLHRQDRGSAIVEMIDATKTAGEGRFRFPDVRVSLENSDANEAITHYLVTTHPQWATAVSIVSRERSNEDLEVVLQRPGELSGVVTDDKGLPVAGAVVYRPSVGSVPLEGVWSDVTDSAGQFSITDVPKWNADDGKQEGQTKGREAMRPSAYFFYVVHPRYGRKQGSYTRIPAIINVQLEPGAIIEGVVVDAVTGRAAAATTVQAQGVAQHGWSETQTDANGRYRLSSLVADRYNIWATAPERTLTAIDSFAILAGETKQAPELRLVSGGFITGRVLDFESGQPISRTTDGWRIRIGLHGPSRPSSGAAVESVRVADDGTYSIRVPPGENRPYLQSSGLVKRTSRTVPFSVQEGETVELDFYVNPQREPKAQ
jgi:hypothetical protein